ncbi:hypothetical protein Acy02nite_15760 [Actinoplanes cyaneus]|uniref:YbaB/EbfC DNA-binding family protein n=1 Tax=Actinoplanes cyaneus TaxID=52696 RepID=A0A919LZ53_9ACTN|nr:YbaB/EbfC family nucleoid-associated protein [Actinoplanes cyaneus]MCW2142149.1 hypothetical protein [Actinoplanes cyaneus]GID63695.1 hypothetical protein Acy02nite_15760 [Actinoplanes cyaneus]
MGDHPNFSPDTSGFVSGEAAAGRVWVELDSAGRLTDLYLDPRVSYLPLEDLRAALIAAFTTAQDRLADRAVEATSRYGAQAAPERLAAALAEASDTAERRFAEIATALNDLNRRAARPW